MNFLFFKKINLDKGKESNNSERQWKPKEY